MSLTNGDISSYVELTNSRYRERHYREIAREDWGDDDDADEGHDQRIDELYDREQLAHNQAAYLRGEYEHVGRMQDVEAEAEEVDMDIIDDGEDGDEHAQRR